MQMLVPVPQYSRPPAHPVFKQDCYSGDPNYPQQSAFLNLAISVPLPPSGGPPLSFSTREEWINSLLLWHHNKLRCICEEGDSQLATDPDMQDFSSRLIHAGNVPIIKGDCTQACIPPLFTLYHTEQAHYPQHFQEPKEDVDEIGSVTLNCEYFSPGPHLSRAAKLHAHSSQRNTSPIFTSLITHPPRPLILLRITRPLVPPSTYKISFSTLPSTPLPSSSGAMPSVPLTCPSPNLDTSSSAQKGPHLLTAGVIGTSSPMPSRHSWSLSLTMA